MGDAPPASGPGRELVQSIALARRGLAVEGALVHAILGLHLFGKAEVKELRRVGAAVLVRVEVEADVVTLDVLR